MAFVKILIHRCAYFTLKMVQKSFRRDYVKAAFLEKTCLYSRGLKCRHPVRLQYSLIVNISVWKEAIDTFWIDFWHGEDHNGKLLSKTNNFGWV